jgi:hypothetical protein
MYKILGTDNKEYGPVSAEQLRQWIVEGRANRSTLAQGEGATSWKPLSLFAEFSGTLASAAPPLQPAPRPVAAVSNGTNGLAVTSLVFGILSVISLPGVICCCAPPIMTAPLGILFGIISLAQLKSRPEQSGRGMAWTGLALSAAVFVLFGCLFLLGVFAGQIEKWLR